MAGQKERHDRAFRRYGTIGSPWPISPTAPPHRRALALTSERADSPLVTTDEVLAEYLTFFATAPEPLRRKVVTNVQRILEDPVSRSFRRVAIRFSPAWLSTQRAPIKAIA